ncbi:hypothetical protein EDC04DRAFT_2611687 [Pisolithus marmoratus]|nr:hypothetical protein EDC04DRAFT_2611687 [Pisolithus marmoratus]
MHPFFQGPSPPNPKTGATPTPSATTTSTPNANTATTNPNITTNPNTGIGAHLTSVMTHIRPGPSAGMCSHPSLTLSTSSHSIWSLTGPSATVSGMSGVGHGASSVSTPGNAKVNGNSTNGGASGSVKAACSNCDHSTDVPMPKPHGPARLSNIPIPPQLTYPPIHPPLRMCTVYIVVLVWGVVITPEKLLMELGTQLHVGATVREGGGNVSGTVSFFFAFNWIWVELVSLFWCLGRKCYNCHMTKTKMPLWREDDEGKTICDA